MDYAHSIEKVFAVLMAIKSGIGKRHLYNLKPGEQFRALIHDIKPGAVTIRLEGGTLYTARSMVLPEARIGEESIFIVRENDFEGRIALEMFKPDESTKRNNKLTELFYNAGMSPTPELLSLGQKLMENGLSLDITTLQKMALFTQAKLDANSVIFLLRENMPINSAKILQKLTNNPLALLQSMIANNCEYYFNPQNAGNYKPLKTYYRELYTQLRKMQKTPDNIALEILEFMNCFKANRKFYQIPYLIADQKPKLAELFTFNKGNGKQPTTAILTMETNSLGRVEVFINSHNILEFRGDNGNALKQLSLLLPKFTQSTGYSTTLKKLETPFTLLSPTPNITTTPPPPQTRYTFDMRV